MRMQIINRMVVLCLTGLLISTLAGCSTYLSHSKSDTETTLILTRHAEKVFFTNVLSEKGLARAKSLITALGDKKITAIYAPDLVRNVDTARPLAKHLNIKITTVGSNPASSEVLNKILTHHSGEVVLWVGNFINLQEMYSQLGGKGEGPVNYGQIFILTIKDKGEPEVVKIHYGAGAP